MNFYVAKVGSFSQYKYAWFEVEQAARYGKKSKLCPSCGSNISGLPWLSPYRVELKQPRNVGDIVFGVGGPDYLVSRRFFEKDHELSLTGIQDVYEPIEITKMGTTKKAKALPKPNLVGVNFVVSTTIVDEDSMNLEDNYHSEHKGEKCSLCHYEREYIKYDRVVIKEETWQGEDFFYPISLLATLVLSERAYSVVKEFGFTNFNAIPLCDESWKSPVYDIIIQEKGEKKESSTNA